VGVGIAVASVTAAIGWYLRNRTEERPPTEWLEVGSVEQLFVYPLKSGAPLPCNEFKCTDYGPILGTARDRYVRI